MFYILKYLSSGDDQIIRELKIKEELRFFLCIFPQEPQLVVNVPLGLCFPCSVCLGFRGDGGNFTRANLGMENVCLN